MEFKLKHLALQENLAHFGLCPQDWSIELQDNQFALVKHTDEDTFQFYGKVNSSESEWEYLQLHSL